jgi:hypothetical protein
MSQLVSTPVDITVAREGARKVLADCLELKHGNRVSIFYDDETVEPAKLLIEEAQRLELQIKERFVPMKHQLTYNQSTGLCENCRLALHDAAAVITCLSANSATTPYRREILRRAPTGTTKVGHIPGASLFVLASAINVDYGHAVARCEDLALALAVGEHATLTTYVMGTDGAPRSSHTLHIELGGFRRMPVVSTGVIPPGTWGNLPGGETFIAPIEDAAHGEIAINGAFKNHVLGRDEALVLKFEGSRLMSAPRGPEGIVRAFETMLAGARSRGDQNYDSLAEFGIGVNQGVKALTGNSLFDEKCAGTVHIALGDSSGFGGKSRSDLHEDLITRGPSLTIDKKLVLENGKDVFREDDWYDDIYTFPVDARLKAAARVMRSSAERAVTRGGILKINHQVGAGRVCMYRVGKAAQSATLLHLYSELSPLSSFKFSDVAHAAFHKYGLTEDETARGLSILIRHRLVSIS